MARRQNAVEQPRQHKGNGEHHQSRQPVGHQLGTDEGELAHRRHVNLLDGSRLLLAHHVQGWKGTTDKGEQHHHQSRNHEELVVEPWVVEVQRLHRHLRQPEGGRHETSFGSGQAAGVVRDDGRQIGTAHTALRAVHRIGGHQHTGRSATHPVLLEIARNLQHNIGRTRLHMPQGLIVSCRKGRHTEVVRCRHLLHQPPRQGAVVAVYNVQPDVLDFQAGRPWHQNHNHTGEQQDEFRDERIPEELLEFFFYQILYHTTFILTGS